jgi:hypothetical protein
MATELRLPSCHAAILVAVLTLFYQTTDLQMWTVLSFAIRPYCASDAVADELYQQQQPSLKNPSPDIDMDNLAVFVARIPPASLRAQLLLN